MENKRGITLIALVITIIVLLVLAGVSLTLVLGDNGVINKVQNATTETRNAEEKEKIEMAVAAARAAGNGVLTTENLNTELDKVFNNGKEVEETNARRLPAEYQEVEYIESTGTQWIDTKIIGKSDINSNIAFEITKTQDQHILSSTTTNNRCSFGVTDMNVYTFGASSVYLNQGEVELNNKYNVNIVFNSSSTLKSDGIQISSLNNNTFNNQMSLYLFARNNSNSTIDKYTYVKLYNCEIYENDILVRSFIPCYSKTTVTDVTGKQCHSGTKGLYDLVEERFYTNQGIGEDFKTGKKMGESEANKWNYEIDENKKYIINNDGKVDVIVLEEKQSVLPKEYQEVEYIESTGTQNINTNLIPKVTLNGEFEIMRTGSGYPFGSTNSQSKDYWGIHFFSGNKTFECYFGTGTYPKVSHWDDNIIYKISIIDKKFYCEDDLLCDFNEINNNYSFNTDKPIYLFGLNYPGGEYGGYRFYKAKFWDETKLLMDFLPCYSTTTVTDVNGKQCPANTKGLYDLVEGKFYTNQGSGNDFIAGPDV